ncbi:MAG: C1 family peptidase [Bacteroidales bacterium]|nr:C1 family peptidase [Bacteroidales bacterium]
MKKSLIIVAALFIMFSSVSFEALSQTAITPEVLEQLKATVQPQDKVVRNALANTSISVLATDASTLSGVDDHFTYRVPNKGITDQASSGRCWLFTSMNVLRSKAINKYNLKGLELSCAYLFFFDQLEKSNLFLQGIIDTRQKADDDRKVDWLFQNPLSDGGTFCGGADLVQKYGVVPYDVMPDNYQANNTRDIDMLLKWKLREMGLELRTMANPTEKGRKAATITQLEKRKVEMLGTIYHILTLAYGVPPTSFSFTERKTNDEVVSSETYTPQSFYAKYWDDDALYDNYIMVMNDPLREYYKTYQIDFDRHTYDGHDWVYLNLPADEIKPMAVASLRDSTAMYFSCDVAKYLNRKNGTLDLNNFDYESLLGTDFKMDKRQRVYTHASGSSHAMTMVAVDIDTVRTPLNIVASDMDPAKLGIKKWMVENSWGSSSGHKGHLIMTDEWFDNYMFRLVIRKEYVAKKYLDMLNQKPTLLPAWDPMFMGEE